MKDRKFPTILGIILLLLILVAGVYLSTQTTFLSSKASGTCEPINPQITNLTYGSFDFSFTTVSSCETTLIINNKIYSDSSTVSNTHYFKVSNLSPSTSYQFNLISGAVTYSRPEYSLTTTLKPDSVIPTSNLAWGKIVDSNNKGVAGAIIYLTIPGSQALSAFSNNDGNWNISFATSFNDNKTDWFTLSSPVDEDLIVYSPDGLLTQLTNRSDNNDPVPNIIIGQDYFSVTPTPIDNNSQLGAGTAQTSSVNISISSPQESETITALRPDIFGQGPASASLKLSLDANSVNLLVPSNGTWHWSPSQNLSLGSHKLVLTYQNKSITRNFIVAINNNNLSFTATPSATLAPTITTLPTQVITPTNIPTIQATSVPTKVPTVVIAKTTTTSTLYKTGATFPTFFLIIMSSLLFSVSLYYYRR